MDINSHYGEDGYEFDLVGVENTRHHCLRIVCAIRPIQINHVCVRVDVFVYVNVSASVNVDANVSVRAIYCKCECE